ncbi:MAG: fructoselysine 3-epimerase [Eubacteriales bacterium]|nr:fructoselysine 3-epimerase [Eubacteriales bacterium]
MKIGMFTSGYQYYPLEYAFRDAKRIGYDYIELWGGRPHAFAPDLASGELDTVKALMEQYEIPVRVYTPEHNAYPYNYMIGTESMRKDAINYLKCAIRMGKEMGADYTLISTGHAGYTVSRKEIEKRLFLSLKELATYGEEIGETIVLESLTGFETNVCSTANDLKDILDHIDSPNLLGMCDVVVPWIQQEPVMNYFEKLGDRCAHLHLVDSDGSSETHVLPGDGSIPMKELLEEIQSFGYDGMATIELVTAYIKEPYLYAKIAHDRVRNMLKK